jgi:hypothetical protein
LAALRADREEMEALIRRFYDATTKAEGSIKNLKLTAEETGKNMQSVIDKSRILRDELSFMLERGDMLAGQLERSITSSRTESGGQDINRFIKPEGREPAVEGAGRLEALLQGEEAFEPKSAAERELLKALKGVR